MNALLRKLRTQPLAASLLRSARRRLGPRFRSFSAHRAYFSEKIGLELGGPSYIFSSAGLFPVYRTAGRIDQSNFDKRTLWDGNLTAEERWLRSEACRGDERIIAEATNLSAIPSGAYDFILSSHMLEHSANPLQALAEWKRVTKPGGALMLVLPHKDGTFDHRRPVTTLSHLFEDFERHVGEDDLTHVTEILQLHDLSLDPPAGTHEQFAARCRRNFENRGMHHHVFDTRLAIEVVDAAGYQIVAVEAARPCHIAVLARNSITSPAANQQFLDGRGQHLTSSPFPSDRRRP